jgi:hypothetical protein
MKTSLQLLILAKNKNQALGRNKSWPLNDKRFYIPQAFCKGLVIAEDFYPYCSESQADFILLARDYWRLSGDLPFITTIWLDLRYVCQTIEGLDSNGNSLPDRLQGSYDYQGMKMDTEEPLMCAKACAAYRAMGQMARALKKPALAARWESLADKLRETMNKPVGEGGLWLPARDGGGYYVNKRSIKKGRERLDRTFIPYENLCPIFFGIPRPDQEQAIFNKLDAEYEKYYPLKYGPMYIAPAARNGKAEVECSTAPWLGCLDVYLRCMKGHRPNRARILKLILDHAYDIPAAPLAEGAGVFGNLTGGAGRAWDNGSFFQMLIRGVYGLEKTSEGLDIRPPAELEGMNLTELNHVCWRQASYDFTWQGRGPRIARILLDGVPVPSLGNGCWRLSGKSGRHCVRLVKSEK